MILVDQLTKRYGRYTAVDSISFSVRPGTVAGFLGPNGAGKSTTISYIESSPALLIGDGAWQPKARETDRSTGRSNTGPEAEPPVVEVSDRGVTDHPTATKE